MPQKWALRFSIAGDLAFISHHDCMRSIERLTVRAGIPLKYSCGFNPRPAISLAAPKPVAVAGNDELLVLSTEGEIDADPLVAKLNEQAPTGMKFTSAKKISTTDNVQPLRMSYQMDVDQQTASGLESRINELGAMTSWPVERIQSPADRHAPARVKTVDLKPLTEKIAVEGTSLRLTLKPLGQSWAKPGEMLELLGLDRNINMAKLVREKIEI